MSKKSILAILFILIISFTIISLYATFAYNEEAAKLDDSHANYNLIYSLKENSNKQITLSAKEEKFVDIILTNTYESTVKYGMYYYLIKPKTKPERLEISLAPESVDLLENNIKPNQTRTISIKVNNASDDSVELVIGALIGFENGNINDLLSDGEVLIK